MDVRELVAAAAEASGMALDAGTAAVDDAGWDFLVLLADDGDAVRWAFRFARRRECGEALEREMRALELLAPVLPVAVPRYELAGTAPSGLPVAAYRAIQGERLSRGTLTDALLDELAAFLATVHALPIERLAGVLPVWERDRWRERFAGLVERGRGVLSVPSLLDRAWRRWLEDDAMWIEDLTVIHGDLGAEHLLVHGGRLAGVIDWTDARIADPALDFADVVASLGHDAARRVLDRYSARLSRPADPGIGERALGHWLVGPAHTAAFALHTEQWEYLDAAQAALAEREEWLRAAG